jgi:hypothetical protein
VSRCIVTKTDSLIKVEENKRKAVFRNPHNKAYQVAKIDGCLVTDDGIRADFAVSDEGDQSVIVELKGSDVGHGCAQVLAAATHPSVKPHLKRRVGFLIVCSKFPKFDTQVRKAKDRAAKQFGSGFHVVCKHGEFDINRVLAINGPF